LLNYFNGLLFEISINNMVFVGFDCIISEQLKYLSLWFVSELGERRKREINISPCLREHYWRGGQRMLMIDILFSFRYYKKRKRILENFPKPSKVPSQFFFF
jgi:hypothetical protein